MIVEREVQIVNKLGIHARPAIQFHSEARQSSVASTMLRAQM